MIEIAIKFMEYKVFVGEIKKPRKAVIASCKVCFLPSLCEWLNVGLAECLSVRMYFCWFEKIDI